MTACSFCMLIVYKRNDDGDGDGDGNGDGDGVLLVLSRYECRQRNKGRLQRVVVDESVPSLIARLTVDQDSGDVSGGGGGGGDGVNSTVDSNSRSGRGDGDDDEEWVEEVELVDGDGDDGDGGDGGDDAEYEYEYIYVDDDSEKSVTEEKGRDEHDGHDARAADARVAKVRFAEDGLSRVAKPTMADEVFRSVHKKQGMHGVHVMGHTFIHQIPSLTPSAQPIPCIAPASFHPSTVLLTIP